MDMQAKRFRTMEEASSVRHLETSSSPVVAVVGGGLVGGSLCVVFARAGCHVRVWEANADVRGTLLERVRSIASALLSAGLLAPFGVSSAQDIVDRVSISSTLEEALEKAAWVQECVPESQEIKAAVFKDIDAALTKMRAAAAEAEWFNDIVLASSTSAIPPSAFTSGLSFSSRCVVAHPVNPPHLIPCVEIVPAPHTAADVLQRAREFMVMLKQSPVILAREVHSFALNRLQGALLNEAMRLVEDGLVTPDDIDATVRDGLGLRWSFMGPFETIDLNAPGGVSDYAARYGGNMHELAKQQADPRPWSDAAIQAVNDAQRSRFALDDLKTRAQWRDRRLMGLMIHKQQMKDSEEAAGSKSV